MGLSFSGGFTIGDVFPSLRFIDVVTGLRRRMWRARLQLDDVFEKIIAQSEAQRGDDLVSILLRIRDEGELELPISTINIKAIILVIVYSLRIALHAAYFFYKKIIITHIVAWGII